LAGIRLATIVVVLILLRILFWRRRRRKAKLVDSDAVTAAAMRRFSLRRSKPVEITVEPEPARSRWKLGRAA